MLLTWYRIPYGKSGMALEQRQREKRERGIERRRRREREKQERNRERKIEKEKEVIDYRGSHIRVKASSTVTE